METHEPIRIILITPGLAVRLGLRALLQAGEEMQIIGEAPSLDELTAELDQADVILLAPSARGSIASLEAWLPGTAAVLVLSEDPMLAQALAGLAAGSSLRAWGLLPPEASLEELLAAIRALVQGLVVGTPALFEPLAMQRRIAAPGDLAESLTDRETEVLQLLAQGLANKQVASRLGISQHTVKFHIASIYNKLGATNRTEAVRYGLQHGLIAL